MIFDHIEKYEYQDDGTTLYYETKMALARLAEGMSELYRQTKKNRIANK